MSDPTVPGPSPEDPFEIVRQQVISCTRCPLSQTRTHAVFGAGNQNAKLLFIGEAPGAMEDLQGLPFVGRSGQLLTQVLEKNGISRTDVFISNIVKCRPPENRDPRPSEIKACTPFLYAQIEMINPMLICVLGRHAAATLLERPVKITLEHGQWMDYRGRRLLIALHPSAALRSPKYREQFETDIASVSTALNTV